MSFFPLGGSSWTENITNVDVPDSAAPKTFHLGGKRTKRTHRRKNSQVYKNPWLMSFRQIRKKKSHKKKKKTCRTK